MDLLLRSGSRFLVGTPARCVIVDVATGETFGLTTLDTVLRFNTFRDLGRVGVDEERRARRLAERVLGSG